MAISEQEVEAQEQYQDQQFEEEAIGLTTTVVTPEAVKAMQPDAEEHTYPLHGRPLYLAIGGLMLSMLVSALDQTIVGTAMPRIISELKGFELISWVSTAYLLTSTAGIPILGKLSDIFGRKYVIMFGIAVFTIGSALCGISQDINQLIYFRALQGIGAGAMQAVIFTVIGDLFSPAERARWGGLFFATFGLASVIGPAVGGFLTDGPGWRWCFYVNIPLEILSFIGIYFTIPGTLGRTRKVGGSLVNELRRIDFGGAFFSLVFIIPLLLALVWGGNTYAWGSWQIIGSFILSAIGLAAFIFSETRASEPVLPLDLFKNDVFAVSTLLGLLTGAAMFGIIFYTPWFVQGVIGANAGSSGAILTPLMISMVIGSIIIGQIISRIGRYKIFVLLGTLTLALGAFLLSGMGIGTDEWVVTFNMIIVGIGIGLFMSVINLAAQNSLPMNRLASGTSALTFVRSIGATIGLTVISTVVISGFNGYWQSHISPDTVNKVQQGITAMATKLNLTAAQVKQFSDNIFSPTSLTDPTFRQQSQLALNAIVGPSAAQDIHQTLIQALLTAVQSSFYVGMGLGIVLFIIGLFLREVPLRTRPRSAGSKQAETSQPLIEPSL